MFIRIKKIQGKTYAYLVKNEWTPWGSRQKVTKYLGRTHTLERKKETETELCEPFQTAIFAAIRQELNNCGFIQDITFNPALTLYKLADITVNLAEKTVRHKKKAVVLAMNEGFLCDHTIKELLAYKHEENTHDAAKKLANLTLEAGLKLSNEQFVKLYELASLSNSAQKHN